MADTELINSFLIESDKLEKLLLEFQSDKITPNNVIPIYYQILHVHSMLKILKQNKDLEQTYVDKTNTTLDLIYNKFNKKLHPLVLSRLDELIQDSMMQLKTNKTKEKTKEKIEQDAKDYENLRQIMSTKEFVEQYDKGMKP